MKCFENFEISWKFQLIGCYFPVRQSSARECVITQRVLLRQKMLLRQRMLLQQRVLLRSDSYTKKSYWGMSNAYYPMKLTHFCMKYDNMLYYMTVCYTIWQYVILYDNMFYYMTLCFIILPVNFLSSHWLRSVCQVSLSHGRVW